VQITYQWYSTIDGNRVALPGADDNSLTIPDANSGSPYTLSVDVTVTRYGYLTKTYTISAGQVTPGS
jgi:hypothetical protein